MKQYLWDAHVHTAETSPCGQIEAAKIIDLYEEQGYDGIIITDHYSRHSLNPSKYTNAKERGDKFLKGWNAIQNELSKRNSKLRVLLGMEICFNENNNDYLIYGITDSFIYEHDDLLNMGINKFADLAHENGFLVFQAHPFRTNMSVTFPQILDGIEVYNGNPNHDSRNDIANIWADKFNLLKVAGSDFHEIKGLATSGIYTDVDIKTNNDLLKALKKGVKIKQNLINFRYR